MVVSDQEGMSGQYVGHRSGSSGGGYLSQV
jgi:hypothetical protein